MSLDSDILLDRINLKNKLFKWRVLALVALGIMLFALANPENNVSEKNIMTDYIASVDITGIIIDDKYRSKILKDIADDERAKAIIINVDSPGGTTVGGEELYEQIKGISESGKPVVVVMKTLATSAGYMIAVASDYIIARNGTITGSIGVIVQSAEFTDLAEKIGVKFHTFKSGPLKASPSPFEKLDPRAEEVMNDVIADFYNYFVKIVAEGRNLPEEKVRELADGRIYGGRQALELGMIDEIGGQEEALAWLVKEKNIAEDIAIEDITLIEPEHPFRELFFGEMSELDLFRKINMNGLLALWNPNN